MQPIQAPNTDPLPAAATCCVRSTRKPTRWTPYGSRSAPPVTRRDSLPLETSPAPGYTLPLSPELTPASGPSTGSKSHPVTVQDIPESACGEKPVDEAHEKRNASTKNEKQYEYTDDFIDVLLGILSLVYCSPLLIAGGRTFVIPQNFASQPPPVQTHDPASTAAIGHYKPNHMRWFIERLLERTRPPRAVCQLAVAYLVSVSGAVQNELRAAAEARLRRAAAHHPLALPMVVPTTAPVPLPVPLTIPAPVTGAPLTPDTPLPPPYSDEPPVPAPMPAYSAVPIGMPPVRLERQVPAVVSPLLDPRRVLLAVVVLAHKFHLDKTWTNKAWAKVSGLEPREVGRCERTVAIALGHRLWAGRV